MPCRYYTEEEERRMAVQAAEADKKERVKEVKNLTQQVNELTRLLCTVCREIDKHNGPKVPPLTNRTRQGKSTGNKKIKLPSEIAKWWASHQKLDEKRIAAELQKKERAKKAKQKREAKKLEDKKDKLKKLQKEIKNLESKQNG